jgi:hypothetical protein
MTDRRRPAGERRRHRRAPFVAAVRERIGDRTQLALAQNLGEQGMELRRPAAISDPVPLELDFELPDGGGLIRVRGTVTFERSDGQYQHAGVRFGALSAGDRARIARFLRNS